MTEPGRLPGTTPAAPDDAGAADAALAAALRSDDIAAALVRLPLARLLLPVVAAPVATGEAEMTVPELVRPDGARALPAFSSVGSLAAWRVDARPVPMPGARLIAGAVAQGFSAIVLDVAGPVPLTVHGSVLERLAEASARLASGAAGGISLVAPPADPCVDGGPERRARR